MTLTPDGSSLEFGDLQAAVEHTLNEGRFLEDLVRLAGQFELFDNLGRLVHLQNDSGGRYSEVGFHLRNTLVSTLLNFFCFVTDAAGNEAIMSNLWQDVSCLSDICG